MVGITKVGVDTVSVLVVASNMVLWIVMVRLSVVVWSEVMSIMLLVVVVGVWMVGVVVSRVPVVVVSVMPSIVVFSHVEAMVAMSVMESVMIIMMVHWFHFQHQVSSRCVDVGWVENGRVSFEST